MISLASRLGCVSQIQLQRFGCYRGTRLHGILATQDSKTEFDTIDLPPETTPTGYLAAFVTVNANGTLANDREDQSQQVRENVPQHNSVFLSEQRSSQVLRRWLAQAKTGPPMETISWRHHEASEQYKLRRRLGKDQAARLSRQPAARFTLFLPRGQIAFAGVLELNPRCSRGSLQVGGE